jgi:carbonic anhydrase
LRRGEIERRHFLEGLAILGACPICARAGRAAEGTDWGYSGATGPEHWGDSAENVACSLGSQQSPLDITVAIEARLPAIELDWPKGGTIRNTGKTIQIDAPRGGTLGRGGKLYELVQYHFHAPSEHRVEGRSFAMEAHFVHKHAASGDLGVLAVLLTPGAANPTFASLAAAFPEEGSETSVDGTDPAGLLPASLAYWTYEGSLTSPPCSENVDWMIARTPVQVAAEDISAFTAHYPMNARPVLPANRRFILAAS